MFSIRFLLIRKKCHVSKRKMFPERTCFLSAKGIGEQTGASVAEAFSRTLTPNLFGRRLHCLDG